MPNDWDVIEHHTDLVCRNLPDGTLTFVNKTYCEIFGKTPSELIGSNFYQFIPEAEHSQVRAYFKSFNATKTSAIHEHLIRTKQGAERWLEWNNNAILDAKGTVVEFIGIGRDITERKRAETALRKERDFSTAAINSLPGIFCMIKPTGRLVLWNRNLEQVTGYSYAEISKMGALDFFAPRDRLTAQISLSNMLNSGVASMEVSVKTKTGALIPYFVSGHRFDLDGIPHVLGMGIDISAQRDLEKRLRHMAHHDPLTGLPNRLDFTARLDQAVARARRERRKIAILFLDLDGFKTVNDSQGHHAGDELLRQVARRLTDALRETDMVARIGGDEFAFLIDAKEGTAAAEFVAAKVIAALTAPFDGFGPTSPIGASIGVSVCPDHATTGEALLIAADAAMYAAKTAGGGFQFASSDDLDSQ